MLNLNLANSVALLAMGLTVGATQAEAQGASPAAKASPEVYDIVKENDLLRVTKVSWKPGQRDNYHSHPSNLAAIFVTACRLRLFKPDGTYVDTSNEAGEIILRRNDPIASQSVQNIGSKPCEMTMVEVKS